jgi:hypothetical protein
MEIGNGKREDQATSGAFECYLFLLIQVQPLFLLFDHCWIGFWTVLIVAFVARSFEVAEN